MTKTCWVTFRKKGLNGLALKPKNVSSDATFQSPGWGGPHNGPGVLPAQMAGASQTAIKNNNKTPPTGKSPPFCHTPFWLKPCLGVSGLISGYLVWPGYGHREHRLRAVVGDWLSHYFVLKASKLAIQCDTRRGYPSRSRTRKETAPGPICLGRRCSTAAIPHLGNS